MSDNVIRVGDLVQVVRGHICDIGNVFEVGDIVSTKLLGGWHCLKCMYYEPECDDLFALEKGANEGSLLRWLRRIPPLAELDESEHREETPA